jgi:hypothetical protein
MARDTFINPANGFTYEWHVNHTDEESTEKTRTITRVGNTGLVGVVRQQGDDSPYIMRWTGTILHRAQLQAFWFWWAVSKGQTIHLLDFDGQRYEVQITSFQPKRVRKLSYFSKDPSMPHHYYTYTIEFEVYSFVAGDMNAWVTP